MTLDDERMSWPAAEAMERGENPERMSPETAAAKIAEILFAHADLAADVLSDGCKRRVGRRAYEFRTQLVAIFDATAEPRRGPQLQHDYHQPLEDVEFWGEHLHHLERECADARAIYERVRKASVPEYDPDARDQDREDDRAREARQDETAREQAPKVAS